MTPQRPLFFHFASQNQPQNLSTTKHDGKRTAMFYSPLSVSGKSFQFGHCILYLALILSCFLYGNLNREVCILLDSHSDSILQDPSRSFKILFLEARNSWTLKKPSIVLPGAKMAFSLCCYFCGQK